MFVFSENPTFWWPCKVVEPDPSNPGQLVEQEFEALFEMLDPDDEKAARKARNAIIAKITPELSEAEMEKVQDELDLHDRTTTLRALKDWRGVVDANNQPIPFNGVTFPAIYKHRRVRNALIAGYMDATTGDKARLGN